MKFEKIPNPKSDWFEWHVKEEEEDLIVGEVRWISGKYVFYPNIDFWFDDVDLREISNFCQKTTFDRKNDGKKPEHGKWYCDFCFCDFQDHELKEGDCPYCGDKKNLRLATDDDFKLPSVEEMDSLYKKLGFELPVFMKDFLQKYSDQNISKSP